MFDVFADEICFDRRRVARFEPGIPATLRDEVELMLNSADGELCEDKLENARDEAREEGHKAGHEEGFDAGREAGSEQGFREGHEEGFEEGYAKGRKEGAEAAGKVEDVARLDALLARVALAEAKLRQALNGVKEEGKYKPRTLKVSEFKTVARECFLELQRAKIDFARPQP